MFCSKGRGPGKTTFITNLAVYFSQKQFKTILIDLDHQSNDACSSNLKSKKTSFLNDYLLNDRPINLLYQTINDHLTVIGLQFWNLSLHESLKPKH